LESAALLQCIADNNCQNNQCIQSNCGAELFACTTGGATCSELAGCVDMCAGDQACESDCFYESTGLAQAQLGGLQQCVTNNNCQDDACIAEFCLNESQSCFGGMSDVLPCPIIAECLIDCAGDPVCELGCGRATPETAADAEALAACAVVENCDTIDCTQNACPNEWGVCVSGANDCATVFACVVGCGGADICQYACITEGDFAAQVLVGTLFECIQTNSCVDQACIDQNCGVQSMACGL
jgi:hypothetical protein